MQIDDSLCVLLNLQIELYYGRPVECGSKPHQRQRGSMLIERTFVLPTADSAADFERRKNTHGSFPYRLEEQGGRNAALFTQEELAEGA
jgi:hypothetical protein